MTAGRLAVAYINTGTYATPVWTEMKRITDVKRPESRSSSDRMYRGAKSKKKVVGYIERGFEFKYQIKSARFSDTVFTKLQDSFLDAGIVLDVLFLNQSMTAPTGTTAVGTSAVGIRMPCCVEKFDLSEADEDGVSRDVTLVEVDHEESGALVESIAFTSTVTAV